MNLLGDYIKKYRAEHNLSLRQFARICDISHTHIDSIERGVDPRTGKVVKITNETILKIAKAIDVKPDFLFNLSIGIDSSKEEKEFEILAAHKASPNKEVKNIPGLKDMLREIVKEELGK